MNVNTPTQKTAPTADANVMMADLAALRADVALLAGHVRDGAVNVAETAASQLSTEASRLIGAASETSKNSLKAVEKQIDAHPMMSLMLAFSLGFFGSRLLSK